MKTRKKYNKKKHKNNRITNKKFKKQVCSPTKTNTSFTCYSSNSLEKMRNLWNARHPDYKIDSTTPKKIWDFLQTRFQNVCNTESCWLRQQFMANNLDSELLVNTFAPNAPTKWLTNPNEWLNSMDLENVMKQYENKYHCFEFIGPSPIDFDDHKLNGMCVWDELCTFDIKQKLEKGKTKIAVIFNLDPHYKSGSHWVSLFINIKKKFIFFLDSNGDKIPKRINTLVKRIISQAKKFGLTLEFFQNYPRIHQKQNTECGIYSLYMIIQLLEDKKTPNYFINNRVPDKSMEKMRKKYFNINSD